MIANKSGKPFAIQAKRDAGPVGNKAVQEVVSGKSITVLMYPGLL
ncbi:hypothetical protein [Rossellomorea aquimaris]|uniref:Uncharacterized protein n=1 Tax=Rossellomorea aquimaris TaxID=189382 RepID=A0A5D4U7P0_9BACI|nr:hypothetical protein FZD05_17505 [Rossellomorea aquimaris]TYS83119.1 hypothetical protein FZC85_18105 [Rossellomorea aquimaris]